MFRKNEKMVERGERGCGPKILIVLRLPCDIVALISPSTRSEARKACDL